jgi:hypothetical protein
MWEIAGTNGGNDESAATTFAPLTQGARKALSEFTKKRVFRFAKMPNPAFSKNGNIILTIIGARSFRLPFRIAVDVERTYESLIYQTMV